MTDENSANRMSKNEYYLAIALAVSKRSTCLKRRYGAVIVNNDEIVSTGYNGNPRGEENCCDRGNCKRMNLPSNSGNYNDCFSVHAEQNAMLSASRGGNRRCRAMPNMLKNGQKLRNRQDRQPEGHHKSAGIAGIECF